MVDFVYRGEAKILQEDLDGFLLLAEDLQLIGLTGNDETYDMSQKQTYYNAHGRALQFNTKVKEENMVLLSSQVESKVSNHTSFVAVDSMGQMTKQTVQVHISKETARKVETMITQVQVSEETAKKVQKMIKKQDGFWTCLVCDYKSSKNSHLKEHVETHIKGRSRC